MSIWLQILLAALVAIVSYLVWATAILSKVEVVRRSFPEKKIAYVSYVGSYNAAYQQTSIVEKGIKEKYGIDLSKEPCFGLYYDDPGKVKPENCRSVIGKFLPSTFKETEAPEGITFSVLPKVEKSLQIEYPLRSILCIFTGLMRAYPALERYVKENKIEDNNKYAMMEVYGFENSKILYLAVIEKAEGLWEAFPKNKTQ